MTEEQMYNNAYLSPPQNVILPWRAQESHNMLGAARKLAHPVHDKLGGVGGGDALCVDGPFIWVWSV